MHRNVHLDHALDQITDDQIALSKAARRKLVRDNLALSDGTVIRDALASTAVRTKQGAVALGAASVLLAPQMAGVAAAQEQPTDPGTPDVSSEGAEDTPAAVPDENPPPEEVASPDVGQIDDQPVVAIVEEVAVPVEQVTDPMDDVTVPVDEVTDPIDQEPVDQEPVDQEPVDQEPVDQEPVDQEPVEEEEDRGSTGDGTIDQDDNPIEPVTDDIVNVVVVGEEPDTDDPSVDDGDPPAQEVIAEPVENVVQQPVVAADSPPDEPGQPRPEAVTAVVTVAPAPQAPTQAAPPPTQAAPPAQTAPVSTTPPPVNTAAPGRPSEPVTPPSGGSQAPRPVTTPAQPTTPPSSSVPAPPPATVVPTPTPSGTQTPTPQVSESVHPLASPQDVDPVAASTALPPRPVPSVDPSSDAQIISFTDDSTVDVPAPPTLEERIQLAQSRPVDEARVLEWTDAVVRAWTHLQAGETVTDDEIVALPDVADEPTLGWSYEVQSGDSLWDISREAWGTDDLTTSQISATSQIIYTWNADALGDNPDEISPGTVIQLPLDAGVDG